MPHPIPEKPWSADFEYILVALPADRGFLRAAWAAYTDLGDPAWWGLEGLEADSDDAAQRWLEAIGETFRVMGWTDDVINHIDEIETLLKALQRLSGACCPENTEPLPPDLKVDDNYPTTPPATWGDETIADSDDWEDLVCGAAHEWLDELIRNLTYLDGAWEEATIVISAIAAILGGLASGGILAPVAYGVAAAVTTALVGTAYQSIFPAAATALEAARDDIVCDIVAGDAAALETTIENTVSATAWTLFLQWFDYETIVSIIVTGETPDGTNLIVDRTQDCGGCGVPYDFIHDADFETDLDGYDLTAGNRNDTNCTGIWSIGVGTGQARILAQTAANEESYPWTAGDHFFIEQIAVDHCANDGDTRLTIHYHDGTSEQFSITTTGETVLTPADSTKRVFNTSGSGWTITITRPSGSNVRMSRIRVWYRVVTP